MNEAGYDAMFATLRALVEHAADRFARVRRTLDTAKILAREALADYSAGDPNGDILRESTEALAQRLGDMKDELEQLTKSLSDRAEQADRLWDQYSKF